MSRFLFTKINADGSYSLFASDGTATGTTDLGISVSADPDFTAFDGKLVLAGTVGTASMTSTAEGAVFTTDGTTKGTSSVTLVGPGGYAIPEAFAILGKTLLVSAQTYMPTGGIWATTDGVNYTELVSGTRFAGGITVAGTYGYFVGLDYAGNNAGLWRTDGTVAGTVQIASSSGATADPVLIGGITGSKIVFAAGSPSGQTQLFVTGGSAASTHVLTAPGLAADLGATVSGATAGGKAYFSAMDAQGNDSAWVTDGTAAGTIELFTGQPEGAPIPPVSGFVAFGDRMLFTEGGGLFVTDGTAAGTIELEDMQSTDYVVAGDNIFFAVQVGDSPYTSLYVSDGTIAGTRSVGIPSLLSLQSNLTVVGGSVVFSGLDESGKEALFSSDGTSGGSSELSLQSGIALDPDQPPVIAALPDQSDSGIVTLGGGNQFYSAAPGISVVAGTGSDTITAASGGVSVQGGSGGLQFSNGTAASTVTGGTGAATIFGGAGGGAFAGGSSGGNILVGQGASDANTTLTGAASGDRLFGSAQGKDVFALSGSADTVVGGNADSAVSLGSGSGSALIFAGAGAMTIGGAASGQNTVVGGSGSLSVASDASEAVFGGTGPVSVTAAGSVADSIVGGSGNLSVTGQGANLLVVAGAGLDTIAIGNGAALIFTAAGQSTITGGVGSLQMVLGAGSASITEGAGAAVYQLIKGSAGGNDVINGFKPASDSIELFGYGSSDPVVSVSGGNTLLSLSDGSKITLVGITNLGHSILG